MKLRLEPTPKGGYLCLNIGKHRKFLEKPPYQPLFKTRSSELYSADNGRVLAKFIRPTSFPKDYLRRLIGFSQASREYNSAKLMQLLGIRSIEVYSHSILLNLRSDYESVLYMKYLEDGQTAREYLAENKSQDNSLLLLNTIAKDLAQLFHQGYVVKDLHFGNILVSEQLNITWIDNDVRTMRSNKKRINNFKWAINRLQRRCRDFLSESEWQQFSSVLAGLTQIDLDL